MREKRSDKNGRTGEIKGLEKYIFFTRAEIAIVSLVECGFSNKEIAKILSKSEQTVKGHLTNVYAKLSIKNRYQLMAYIRGLKSGYRSQS